MPKIIEIVKADTLVTNEPDWFERAEFDSDSELGSNYQNYDYIAFTDNGDIYAINGNSSTKRWDATLFETKGSEAPSPDRYKAIRNVAEVKPGGLTQQYETRKALIAAIEQGEAQFIQTREASSKSQANSARQADQNPALSRYEKRAAGSKQLASSHRQTNWPLNRKILIGACVVIALMILIAILGK